jgi:hypothetical protein
MKKPIKKPVGRPALSDADRRKPQFTIKSTDEVAAIIRQRAKASGINVTAYLIMCALR